MTTKILVLLVMLLLSASLAGVAVCEDETNATGGYTVTPAKDVDGDAGIRWVYDTITQGETNWHSKIVSTNINTGRINLDIYNPDGIAKGTWRYEVYGHSVVGTEDYYI